MRNHKTSERDAEIAAEIAHTLRDLWKAGILMRINLKFGTCSFSKGDVLILGIDVSEAVAAEFVCLSYAEPVVQDKVEKVKVKASPELRKNIRELNRELKKAGLVEKCGASAYWYRWGEGLAAIYFNAGKDGSGGPDDILDALDRGAIRFFKSVGEECGKQISDDSDRTEGTTWELCYDYDEGQTDELPITGRLYFPASELPQVILQLRRANMDNPASAKFLLDAAHPPTEPENCKYYPTLRVSSD